MSSPRYFSGAHGFHADAITINNHPGSPSDLEKSFQFLYENIAIEAAHNSEERSDAPACHEDTRKAVQEEVHSWITSGDRGGKRKKILSLMGPAGAGKTAIAGSVADACDDVGLLAGTFFFASLSASEARRSKRFLVSTLVYHLISSLSNEHPLRRAVILAVQRDPSVFRKRLRDQFKILLIRPLSDTLGQFDVANLPKVFILDGLDEVEGCDSRQPQRDAQEVRFENERDQEEILSALLYAANSDVFPFRIIISSRPERVITTFLSTSAKDITKRIFLDNKYHPDLDIRVYLCAKLGEIRRRYMLPSSWPSEEAIRDLILQASGQFVYAATVVRFLQSGKRADPQGLLASLRWHHGALAPLDALYTRVLRSSPDTSLALRWIAVISTVATVPSIFVNQLLQDYEGQASHLLENLSSLLWIPPLEQGQAGRYYLHHKSFIDFLKDGKRCGEEWNFAFLDGRALYYTRSIYVYRNKCPVVPIPQSQDQEFIDSFVRAQCYEFPAPAQLDPPSQVMLTECDVAWWVHRVLARSSSEWVSTRMHLISSWFDIIHIYCQNGNCLPSCKHWRSNILRACAALGLEVPNAVALFRETLVPRMSPVPGFHKWTPHKYFSMPQEHTQRDVTISNSPAVQTQYIVDEKYQATLDLVAAMRAHLPTDRESQFEVVCQGDVMAVHRGFTTVIEKIRQDLGIEEPDVLQYVDWVYRPASFTPYVPLRLY